jgi:hypothetical protein
VTEQKRYDLLVRKFQPQFGLVHAFYAGMGGFAFHESYDDNTLDDEEYLSEISTNPRHILDVPKYETLIYIMKYFPHIITSTTEESILDRAESSSLSKALLVVQVGWFCTNCASRLFQGLPLSLLEVSTAAHAFCTLITYFVWWSKPINVSAPTLKSGKEAREVYALLKCSTEEYDKALEMAREMAAGDSSTPTGTHSSKKIDLAANALRHLLPTPERPPPFSRVTTTHMLVPGSVGVRWRNDGILEGVTMALSPILYGAVHFLAWGDQFPTTRERLLWRVSSFVVTCSGLAAIAAAVFLALVVGVLELSTGIQEALHLIDMHPHDTLCPCACVGLSYHRKFPAAFLSRFCCISAPILDKLLASLLMNECHLCTIGPRNS